MHSRDDDATATRLGELAGRLGIKIRYEPLMTEGFVRAGGVCRIHGQDFVIIENQATATERISVLLDALKRYDLSGIYVLPALREMLDGEISRGSPEVFEILLRDPHDIRIELNRNRRKPWSIGEQ